MDSSEVKARCTWSKVQTAGGTLIRLEGVIDETLDRSQLIEGLGKTVIFDLDGVKRITSYGVREWMALLSGLAADYLGFIHCRPAMLSQFNMVAGFEKGGALISFYAPYLCPACGQGLDWLIDLRTEHAQRLIADGRRLGLVTERLEKAKRSNDPATRGIETLMLNTPAGEKTAVES